MTEIQKIDFLDGYVRLLEDNGNYTIHRYANRGKINNYVENYEFIDKYNNSSILPLTEEIGVVILKRMSEGNYSDAYVIYEDDTSYLDSEKPEKTEQEHAYTSTGIKFWRHVEAMENYKNGNPNTVISTHISPEGTCNLRCPYCSVTYRDTHSRLDMDTIKDYVTKLMSRGLKAVILTGGGEPTIYKNFNELVRWLKSRKLSVALITNGTMSRRIADDVWGMFDWIRVSINVFDGWEDKIGLNLNMINPEKTVVGCSMVYTVEHEKSETDTTNRMELFKKVSKVADQCGAQYIRLLPNCLLEQNALIRQHKALEKDLQKLDDPRFFHQYKVHGAPKTSKCHQSYFRPYLSEEIHIETGKPGTVYPCDSVVLNDGYQFFAKEYQLCHAEDVLDYIDGKITQKFDACKRCKGCVFTDNVDMLDDYIHGKVNRFDEFKDVILMHEEFV